MAWPRLQALDAERIAASDAASSQVAGASAEAAAEVEVRAALKWIDQLS